MADKAHSVLGASSAYRWLACPGSVRLSAGMPKTSSVYAEEGTAAHELAEMCLKHNKDAEKYIGVKLAVNGKSYEVTSEMADAVQIYVDAVRADLAAAGQGAELKIEQQFHLDWLKEGLFGTNDAMVGELFGTLRVFDYKHGAGVAVEAEDNPQMMYYALGAAYGDAYEDVELVIVQPRAHHPAGPVRRCKMTTDELTRWGQEVLLPGAEATEDPEAPLATGDHCRFCPALAVCPKQREQALVVAREAFADTPSAPPAPEVMSLKDLKRVLDVSDMVSAWMDACWAHVKNLIESGVATPEQIGYKLVAGKKGNRAWKDEALAEKWLKGSLGDGAYTKKLLSPSQAEKAMGKEIKGVMDQMVTQPEGKPTLAPLSDKRPAIAPAIAAFGEVEL